MKLGEISQLCAYEAGIEHNADLGNRRNVEFLADLIVKIAREKRKKTREELKCGPHGKGDVKKGTKYFQREIKVYGDWIKAYSPGSLQYEEFLSQADANSRKRDNPPA